MPEEEEAQDGSAHPTDPRTKKRATAAERSVSEAAAGLGVVKKSNRLCQSDDVLDGGRRDVDEHTRQVAGKSETV